MSYPFNEDVRGPLTRFFRALRNGNPPDHGRGDPAAGDHQVQIHPALEIRTVFETAALMAPDPHAAADQLLDMHVMLYTATAEAMMAIRRLMLFFIDAEGVG
ncbi:hypothetical protein [Burkholderia cenocepacia]|uniref:hypothetical protein n=1 Tax=Burkholderia cenocepacia TaxID=95486 RepID=UPI001626B0B7